MNINGKAPVLGIDLGTVTSMACVLEPGKSEPTVIKPHPEPWKYDWMPSAFCMVGKIPEVGYPAMQNLRDPRYRQHVVRCVKRFMRYDQSLFPRHDPRFSPIDVSAYILRHLRRMAEQQLGLPEGGITEAVVTVPAYFGQIERRHTREAAAQAGFDLDKVRLLDEPVAAAFGLGLHQLPGERLALVIDLGGGTLDITLLRVGRGVGACGFQELGRDGYGKLGGIDWDREVAKLAVFQHRDLAQRGPDYLEPDNINLYEVAERAKVQFSLNPKQPEQHIVIVDEYEKDATGRPIPRNFDSIVTRDEFIDATYELAELCGQVGDRLLREVSRSDLADVRRKRQGLARLLPLFPQRPLRRVQWTDIDVIYMVGGGSLNREVQAVIARRWGRPVEALTIAHKPQHQVALGAARCASTLSSRDSLFDGTPLRSPHTVGYFYYPEGKHGPRRFHPVIRRNERITEKHGERFNCRVVGDGRAFSVELAEEQLDPRDDHVEYVSLTPIRLVDLPPRRLDSDERVFFELHCLNEREMQITAEFRGIQKTIKPNASESFAGAGNG